MTTGARMVCPECYTDLMPRIEPLGDEHPGAYITVWTCPNFGNHGFTVACANGCGEQVLNSRQHFSYTPGLIGSGRWSCYKPHSYRPADFTEEGFFGTR